MIKMEDVKIYENDKMKMLRSEEYNYVFEKNTGFFALATSAALTGIIIISSVKDN